MENKLYVGNLSYETSDEDLKQLFSQAGEVKSATIITDRATSRSKGFGFVEMATEEELNKAVTMFNGYAMGDRQLKVEKARPRREQGGGGGPRGRGRGSWNRY